MSAVNPPQRIGIIRRGDMSIEEVEVFFPRPHALAMSEREDEVYSASLATTQLAAVDPGTQQVELLDLEGTHHPIAHFAVSPDGRTLVGTTHMSQLLVFDLSTPSQPALTGSIEVGAQPWHPVFTPDGRWVYFGNKAADEVTIVDMETLTVAGVLRGDGVAQPHGAAVSDDGRFVYISGNNSDGTWRPMGSSGEPPWPGALLVIDTNLRAIIDVIPVGAGAAGVAFGR
jgi:DNA-binding beta-propeller fold protein YncE